MIKKYLEVGIEAVTIAKQITMRYFGKIDGDLIEEKENEDFDSKHYKSPATIADQEAEAAIKEHIRSYFPDHGFIGEEEGTEKNVSDFVWVIDPIDATKNYTRGMDDWAILLALKKGDEVIVGISCMPIVGETICAAKGLGCFCNEKLCQVSDRGLEDAFISHERYKYYQREGLVDDLEKLRGDVAYYIANKTPRMFHYLLQGKLEAIVGYPGNYFYDIAPYIIMAKEAGGAFSTLKGEDFAGETDSFLMTNGVVHDEVLTYFS